MPHPTYRATCIQVEGDGRNLTAKFSFTRRGKQREEFAVVNIDEPVKIGDGCILAWFPKAQSYRVELGSIQQSR